jgi:hypothetical protein
MVKKPCSIPKVSVAAVKKSNAAMTYGRCSGMPPIAPPAQAPRCVPHPTQNGCLRDVEAKHLQLAMNARHTPCSQHDLD